MATIKFSTMPEYMLGLKQLSTMGFEKLAGEAVYYGAKVVMDAVKEELEAVPTDDRKRVPKGGGRRKGPTTEQKKALLKSYGISPMQIDDKGFLNVKVGVKSGYTDIVTKRWPKGQPQLMLARSIESGTSFMEANPFVKKAVRKSRKAAVAAMQTIINEKINKIMK